MLKKVFSVAFLLFVVVSVSQAVSLKAYIKSFQTSNNCTYQTFTFRDSSAYTGSHPNENRDKWYFSDATTDTGTSVTRTFSSTITYTVSLVVTNAADDLKDSTSKTVTISLVGVDPSFTVSGHDCERVELDVTNTSTSSDGNTTAANASYDFNWGDGSAHASFKPSITPQIKVYSTRNTYTITMRDSTNKGCKSSASQTIVINPAPYPRAPFFQVHCQDSSYTFLAVQNGTTDTAGMHVSYTWLFQDNTKLTGKSVKKFFADSGSFTLRLALNDKVNATCNDTIPVNFTVYSDPLVKFGYVPVCEDSIATFYDSTQVKFGGAFANSWHWNFCDSNHANCDTAAGYTGLYEPASFLYGFPNGGKFFVTLTVETTQGCVGSYTDSIYVNPIPTVNFTVNNTCVDSAVQFTDKSTVPHGNKIVGWIWDFDDPLSDNGGTHANTSTLQNPKHKFSHAGYNYQVKMIAITQAGCRDSTYKSVNAWPLPVSVFSAPSECVGVDVPFLSSPTMPNTSTNDYIAGNFWSFGDGTTDTTANPVHAFKRSGYFNVKYSAFSSHGCPDTITVPVFIYPLPKPSFKLKGNCERDSVSFINTSTDSLGKLKDTSYSWDFGDTTFENYVTNPNHLYRYSATFNAKLTAVDSLGCTADSIIPVVIIPGPHSSFSVGPKCTGQPVLFTNTTSSKTPGTIDYLWRFGDGDTSNATNPTHIYSGSKNYRARLISVMPSTGCIDSTQLTLVAVTPTPIAYFKAFSNCLDSSIAVTDSSYVPGYPGFVQSWSFNYGDGQTGTTATSTHKYAAIGVDTIRELVTSTSGCVDSFSKAITIYKVPTANFDYTISCAGTPTPFTDLTPATDSVTVWRWIFSDKDTSFARNPTHVFNDNDILTATETVFTAHGCPTSKTMSVTILLAPSASFTPAPGCDQRPTYFTGFTTNGISYLWNFGDSLDPSGNSSTNQDPIHIYSAEGTYKVSLTEVSAQGCANTYTAPVFVPYLPIPFFSVTGNCFGQPYTFVDTSEYETNFAQWDFGDNTFDVGIVKTHTYASPGSYIVKMVAQNPNCISDTLAKIVIVNPLPIANFTSDTVCFGNTSRFTDSSNANGGGTIAKYAWNYGDGTSDSAVPTPYIYHNYNDTISGAVDSVYNVKLFIETTLGCDSNITKPVVVLQKPKASFTANPNPAVIQFPQISFTNTSIHASPNRYYWTFGDTTDSHEANPVHTYRDTGTYTVTLAASNGSCEDTFSYIVYVTPGYSIYAPNAITANGDNLNDYWMAKGVGVIDFDVTIADRWGTIVFHSTDINEPWKADYNGNGVKVPQGVYVYYIKAGDFSGQDFTTLKGNITVLR